MAAECGLEYDHPKHIEERFGEIFKCDGDSNKRPNHDNSQINKPS